MTQPPFTPEPDSSAEVPAPANASAPSPESGRLPQITRELRDFWELGQDFMALYKEESQSLRRLQTWSPKASQEQRNRLLPRLESGLMQLRSIRQDWERMPAGQRELGGEAQGLLRDIQNLLPRLLMLDRENQQEMLRRGLIPAGQLPPAAAQRPNYVASLYRRHAAV